MKEKQDTIMPEKPLDMSKLSPIQQQVSGYTTTAKNDPPRLSDVKENFTRIEMEIPKGVQRGPEFDYAWLSINELAGISGSKWEIVNRNNHSHVPDRLFDASGGILYKGQNILAFCYREVRDYEQSLITKSYNDKVGKITEMKDRATEDSIGRIDPKTAGSVVRESLVDTVGQQLGFSPESDDF